MKMTGKVEFRASFKAGSPGGVAKKGMGELHRVAKLFLYDRWSNQVRDEVAVSWASLARKYTVNQIKDQEFIRKIPSLSHYTEKRKFTANLEDGILIATGKMLAGIRVRKVGLGEYSVRFEGTASSPFGGSPITMSHLGLILEEGAKGTGPGNRSKIPARPFFAPALKKAAKEVRDAMELTVFKSLFGSELKYSKGDTTAERKY